MKLDAALSGVTRLFLDTSPVIYFVEGGQNYEIVEQIFARVGRDEIEAVSSPITLAECLVVPLRQSLHEIADDFKTLLAPPNTSFASLDQLAESAASLCAKYRLGLPDGFQFAAALGNHCDAFLTNDRKLRRVTELRVLIVGDLTI
jgi:predicted nucleic acid-binding protein